MLAAEGAMAAWLAVASVTVLGAVDSSTAATGVIAA
jgi:hypothetical protein